MALSEADRSIVWTQQAFVVELLRAAEAFGKECQQTVASNLVKAAISNSGLGTTLGGQAAGEGELLAHARRIMASCRSALGTAFLPGTCRHAEHMMQWLSSSHFG